MTTRRQLLARLLGGSVALAAADIWIPGERTIFLPARKPIVDYDDYKTMRLSGLYQVGDLIWITDGPLKGRTYVCLENGRNFTDCGLIA